MKGKILLAAIALLAASCAPAFAGGYQSRYTISTNIPDWATLATINCECQVALDCHLSLVAQVKYNPFTYARGHANQTHLRQITPSAGVRYWFDSMWSGWFAGASLLASEYSVALPKTDKYFDGDLLGAKISGGYVLPLSDRVSLTLGAGCALAYHNTSFYRGPVCGQMTGTQNGLIVFPSDLTVALMFKLGK